MGICVVLDNCLLLPDDLTPPNDLSVANKVPKENCNVIPFLLWLSISEESFTSQVLRISGTDIILRFVLVFKWYCNYCIQPLEVNGKGSNSLAAGRAMGDDPMEQIKAQGIRMKPSVNIDLGACVLCRCHEFSKIGFNDQTVILCDQCEKECHIGCMREHNMADLKKLPKGEWFCRNDCQRINSLLKKLLTHEMLAFWREKQRNDNKNNNNSATPV
ncbi:uncharacterized protein LOC143562343 [Bidens hawaiensis]|uniref:uncharacterized protein LOC143562343 n=1 Tax=Bidens hawaiensis TaxID=980011 RepID=UPI00404938E0